MTDTDPAGNTTLFNYDALGRLVKTETPFVMSGGTTYYSASIYEYDPVGNVTAQKLSSNVPGETAAYRTTEYEYDSMNRLSTAIMYAPDARYTQYYYDALGNVLRTYTGLSSPLTITGLDQVSGSDTDYAETSYTYDSRSNLLKMTDALGQEETYVYTTDGMVASKVDRNGNTTSYTYDVLRRPVQVTVTNDEGTVTDAMTYAYTANGLLRSQGNVGHTTTYTYDSFGRVVEEQTDGATNASVYDVMGNRTSLSVTVNGTVQSETSYTYDELGRMLTMANGTVTASYGYDANGNRSYVEYDNGNREEYLYNLANCPVSVINKQGASTVLSRYDYTYALDGNIVLTEESDGTVTTYAYDGMNQLINETRTEPGGGSQSYVYAYDDFGNRQSLTATGQDAYTVSYNYDLNNRLLEDIKTETGQVTRTTYYYDPNGNQAAKAVDIFSSAVGEPLVTVSDVLDYGELSLYNGFNQLVRTRVNGVEAAYDYAPSGLRLSKTVEGVTTSFVLDGGYVVLELQNGAVTGSYVRALNLVAEISGDEAVYYLYNGHGDVVHLTGSTGAVTRSYEYDAFGNELDPDDQDSNPFRYCAEYFDTETDTYYLRARYYAPSIGRFTQQDTHWNIANMIYGDNPQVVNKQQQDTLGLNNYTYVPNIYAIRQSSNLYVYCSNNPTMFVDPTGEEWYHWVIGGLIVVATAAAVVATAGGVLPAVYAVGAVSSGVAAATAASTMAAGAFIGSSLAFGTAAFASAIDSGSIKEFNARGNWGVVISTAAGAGLGGLYGYILDKASFRQTLSFDTKKLQHEFKHAKDYGITGNWNSSNGAAFEQAIRNQINSVTYPILGTYRGTTKVYHFYNPQTGVNTMIDMAGNYVGGWKLSAEQIANLLRSGNIQ